MTESLQLVTILFADISESSRLYRTLGDARAASLIAAFLDQLTEVTHSVGGQVVDRIGDEVMASFPTAEAAVRAAVGMQWATQEFPDSRAAEGVSLAVRIGFHAGQAAMADGRPVGQAVYRAKRVVDQAKAHQIVLDGETGKLLGATGAWELRPMGTTGLKGQDRPAELLEVLWNANHGTSILPNRPGLDERIIGVEIECGQERLQVEEHQRVAFGRLPPCDVVLADTAVSRTHAHIISRTQGVYLKDVSRNGCYIKQDGEQVARFLHREEVALAGAGLIGFGRAPAVNAPHTIRYRCIADEELAGRHECDA